MASNFIHKWYSVGSSMFSQSLCSCYTSRDCTAKPFLMVLRHSCLDMCVSLSVCWNGGFAGSMCTNFSNNQSSPSVSVLLCSLFWCYFVSLIVAATQSLVMTTTVLGLGLRKTQSSLSLLHEIVSLIHREMEAVNRVHEAGILSLSFQVLTNSCQSQECRNVIAKVSDQSDQSNYVCT
jgi:hypothetical protein